MRFFSDLLRLPWNAMRWAGVFFLLIGQITPACAQGTGGFQVGGNTAVLQPPQQVVFTFSANSHEVIDEVTVIYGYSGHGCDAEGTRMGLVITPGKQVTVRWVKDFNKSGGMLPGAELWWQFEIHNKAGEKMLTDRQTLLLMDTSHRWNTQEEGPVSLFWYEGSQPFGERLMDFASASLQKLEKDVGMKPTGQIRIVVYPSAGDMRDSLGYLNDWAGGVAMGEYNLILVGISPMDDISWAYDVILHELTHVITETGFVNCHAVRLPVWLVEGIAEYTEGSVSMDEQELVVTRLMEDTLPELKTMRYNFPFGEEEAHLAYAQSKMVVAYMVDTYGSEKINQLVESIRGGQTIDQGLRVIYGLNTEELDRTWRAEMGVGIAPEPNFITETPVPTRTPIPTLDLHPSLWTPGPRPTATTTITATATAALPSTATPPATRTPIPDGRVVETQPPSPSPAQPTSSPWLLLAAGVIVAIGLVSGVGIWAIRRVK